MDGRRQNRLKDALAAARGAFVAVGVFSLFINVAALIVPLYMLQIYDRVLVSQSRETLVALTVLALALLAVLAVVDAARTRVLVRIGARLDETLSAPLFGAALAERETGQASQSLRDLESVRSFMTGPGILALFDAPWTPIYLAVIYLFHPWLGAVATVGGLIILCLAALGEIAVRSPLREAGTATRWSDELVEIFARNSNAVRVMGMMRRLEALWQSHRRAGVAWQTIAGERLGILQAMAKSIRMALQVAALGVGAWLVLDHATTAGVMIAASIVMGRALAPIEAALGQWRGFVNARAAHRRLRAALDRSGHAEERMALPAPAGRIEVDNAGLRLGEGTAPILSAIGLRIEAGETLGIVGPSGAGKSSLARILVGIQAPTLGSVRIDGVEVSAWPKEDLGPYLGYLPQEVELLGGTVGQNICRFGETDGTGVVEAAKRVGAHDMILRLPQGYDTPIEDGGRNLSGGQRQRIGLARALYGAARLIVLDEPSANLDGDAEQALCAALAALKAQGRTIVVVTHRPALLATADKLLVLSEGRVKLFGPAASVRREMSATLLQTGPRRGATLREVGGAGGKIDDTETAALANRA